MRINTPRFPAQMIGAKKERPKNPMKRGQIFASILQEVKLRKKNKALTRTR